MNRRTHSLLCAISAAVLASATLAAHAEETTHIDTRDCNVPAYQHDWQSDEESGDVLLQFQVDTKGKVKSVKLVESSGWADLDLASVRALKHCVFKNAASAKDWEAVRFTWVLK